MKPCLKIKMIMLSVTIVLLSGCATRSMYQEANNDFAEGYDAANGTLTAILSSTTRDMRLQAIGYYIENGNNEKNLSNINTDEIKKSFTRYACAGYGLYANEFGNLNTLDAYKSHIAELSKKPADNLSGLVGSIKQLDKPQPILSLPEEKNPEELQLLCRTDVENNLPPGETLERDRKEDISATFSTIKQVENLVKNLENAAIQLLQVVDDAKRTKALRKYVLINKGNIQDVLDQLTNSESIPVAWKIRKNAALVVPYYRFTHMLVNVDRKKEIKKLLEQEAAVHESLAAYDQLGVIPSPEKILEQMNNAQNNLVLLAEGKLKPGQAWAAFLSFRDSVSAINDAIGTATSTVKKFEL